MNNNNNLTGIRFIGLLTIVFIVLKLIKVITWSWWWVLSPVWIPLGIFLLIMLIALIMAIIKRIAEKENIEGDSNKFHR